MQHKIILASQSPRRKQLLEMAEVNFEILIADVDETNPPGMAGELVPEFLARKKADAVRHLVNDAANAIEILHQLSGRMHKVVTGVCIRKGELEHSFSTTTEVYFRKLSSEQIAHYVANYKPYDKAGAYAIQEWIGVTGIEKINGDYYNVMGLPIGEVMIALREFETP